MTRDRYSANLREILTDNGMVSQVARDIASSMDWCSVRCLAFLGVGLPSCLSRMLRRLLLPLPTLQGPEIVDGRSSLENVLESSSYTKFVMSYMIQREEGQKW